MTRFVLALFSMTLLTVLSDSDTDANAKDLEKMQGDWAVVSVVRDGVKDEDDNAQSLFRTIKGDKYTVFLFDKAIGNGTFKIDATKKPKTIDSFPTSLAGKALLGIYEIEGGRIKTCYAGAGKERPTEFSSEKDSGNTLMVWEKEKK